MVISAVCSCAYMWIRAGNRRQVRVISLKSGTGSDGRPESLQVFLSVQYINSSWFHWWTKLPVQRGRVSHRSDQLLWFVCVWSKQKKTCRLATPGLPVLDTWCWFSLFCGPLFFLVISCPDGDPSRWGEVRSAAGRLRAPPPPSSHAVKHRDWLRLCYSHWVMRDNLGSERMGFACLIE